jgi:hypothetical protein
MYILCFTHWTNYFDVVFICGMTNPTGTRYPIETRWVWVWISTREYRYEYKFLPTVSLLMTDNYSIRSEPDPLSSLTWKLCTVGTWLRFLPCIPWAWPRHNCRKPITMGLHAVSLARTAEGNQMRPKYREQKRSESLVLDPTIFFRLVQSPVLFF